MYSLVEFSHTYRSDNSGASCRPALAKFVEHIYHLKPPSRFRGPEWYQELDTYSIQYLKSDRDHAKDLVLYIRKLESHAPKTVQKEISFIRIWLESNDIELKKSDLRMLRMGMLPGIPISEEDEINPEILHRMFSHMRQPLRSIVLVLMSSGLRIGELLSLNTADLDLTTEPATVTIRATKTKTSTARYTFISSEAVAELREWMLIRDDYMTAARKRWRGSKPWTGSPLLFPFSEPTVNGTFRTVLRKTQMFRADENTRRATIHLHMFRKYFISQLKAAGMTADIVEMLAGHAGPYHDAYRQYTDKQVRQAYLNAEYAVSLSGAAEQMRETQDRVNWLESEVIRNRQIVDQLMQAEKRIEHHEKRI